MKINKLIIPISSNVAKLKNFHTSVHHDAQKCFDSSQIQTSTEVCRFENHFQCVKKKRRKKSSQQ